jgi:predicted dehydrogenase
MQKRIQWALIGCGDISERRVAPALVALPEAELISVSRKRSGLAETFARRFDVPKWFESWEEQIRDPEIDAVYVATPVNLHEKQVIRSAEAGKHVLCEKPMAMNRHACQRMIDACHENGVKLGVAYYRHFYPVLEEVKQIIQKDEIGQVTLAQMNGFSSFNRKPDEPRAWLLDRKQSGGGPMIDFGCHRIEVLVHLFGKEVEVTGVNANLLYSDRDVEDTSVAVLKFQSGALALLTVTHTAEEYQDTLMLYGSKGSIHVPNLNQGHYQVIRSERIVREDVLPPHSNYHQPLIADFNNAILEDREPVVDGETGKRVAAIVDRIYGNP